MSAIKIIIFHKIFTFFFKYKMSPIIIIKRTNNNNNNNNNNNGTNNNNNNNNDNSNNDNLYAVSSLQLSDILWDPVKRK